MATQMLADNNFLLPNYTFFVEVIVFLVIMAVLGRFVVPRLQKTLTDRRSMLQRQIDQTEQARTLLADAQRTHQEALTAARTEAADIREKARAEAQRTIDGVRTEAQEESARILARGEAQLDAQRSAIVRELRSEIGTLAVELSEKIMGQRFAQESAVTSTVEDFLAGLAAEDHAHNNAHNHAHSEVDA